MKIEREDLIRDLVQRIEHSDGRSLARIASAIYEREVRLTEERYNTISTSHPGLSATFAVEEDEEEEEDYFLGSGPL